MVRVSLLGYKEALTAQNLGAQVCAAYLWVCLLDLLFHLGCLLVCSPAHAFQLLLAIRSEVTPATVLQSVHAATNVQCLQCIVSRCLPLCMHAIAEKSCNTHISTTLLYALSAGFWGPVFEAATATAPSLTAPLLVFSDPRFLLFSFALTAATAGCPAFACFLLLRYPVPCRTQKSHGSRHNNLSSTLAHAQGFIALV